MRNVFELHTSTYMYILHTYIFNVVTIMENIKNKKYFEFLTN